MTYKRVQNLLKVSRMTFVFFFLYFDWSDKPKIACNLFVPLPVWLMVAAPLCQGGRDFLFSSFLFIRASLPNPPPTPPSPLLPRSRLIDPREIKDKQKAIIIVDSIGLFIKLYILKCIVGLYVFTFFFCVKFLISCAIDLLLFLFHHVWPPGFCYRHLPK